MKYIGKKQIEAQPMVLGEFIKHSGRNPYANCADMHADEEPGYVIMYEDGYVSWSPKATFEKAYRVAETYLDRMRIELQEVRERLMKLNDFLYSEKRDNISKDDVYLLEEQRNTMERYLKILLNRITLNIRTNHAMSAMPADLPTVDALAELAHVKTELIN